MGIESKLNLSEVVENTERKFGAALKYAPVYVVYPDGTEVPAMFTINAIENAIKTAAKNPEDMPNEKSFFERLFRG